MTSLMFHRPKGAQKLPKRSPVYSKRWSENPKRFASFRSCSTVLQPENEAFPFLALAVPHKPVLILRAVAAADRDKVFQRHKLVEVVVYLVVTPARELPELAPRE